MANGAWSNDQLNQILVYDVDGTTVILRVDSDGLYYYNVANGSFFKVAISPFPVDHGAVAIFLNPGESSIPGVVYGASAFIIGGELELPGEPGTVAPELFLESPKITGKAAAQFILLGETNTSAGVDDSEIDLGAAFIFGLNSNEIGGGTLDEGGGYSSNNFTTTEIAADYSSASYGIMVTTRRYHMQWSGTVQSSAAGDRVGLRLYHGPNQTSLTGATQMVDFGQITIAAANIPQPFHVIWTFNGVTDPFILLGARRVTGSGTCFLTTTCRKDEDVVGAY